VLKSIKCQFILFCFFTGFILPPNAAYAVSITLTWDASESGLSDVSGYKIYYGTESGNYSYTPIDAGNVTSYTINNLDEDVIYYLTVTAYAKHHEESKFSIEVSTFNEFTGTAQIFPRKLQWNPCELQSEPSENVEVYLSFNFLLNQFIYKPEGTLLTCDPGTFIQRDDNTIEAKCFKKGPLGIVTLNYFIFEGFGNASLREPLALNAKVFNIFNQACPLYVIKLEGLLPVQE
jgi:hypothetical protein